MWSLFNKSFSDSCGSSRGAVKATRSPKPISKKKEYDISAEEARKLADIGNEEKKKKELDDILKYINIAAENGDYYVIFYKLSDKTIEYLKEKGFEIHIYDRQMRISWEKEELAQQK